MEDYEFYKSVSKTNPKFVKNQQAGGRKITTIDPQSQTETATEKWGLYGKEGVMLEVQKISGTNTIDIVGRRLPSYAPSVLDLGAKV